MLSYQHAYHAGNMADVQKHALLAVMLDYLGKKDKPFSYIETHAGRGLYDLGSAEAAKTGEAAVGIDLAEAKGWFPKDHPYARVLTAVRRDHGPRAYPGSPLVAAHLLRPDDRATVCELHPQEYEALLAVMLPWPVACRKADGMDMALALTPPEPRRGLMLIDPSWEVKADYEMIPKRIAAIHRKWNVGTIALWYPILTDGRHRPMTAALAAMNFPKVLQHELRFPPARDGHGMVGSGMFIVNTPFGTEVEAARLDRLVGNRR
ncbi:23S rRNA (adenine(2030)-N(6))-methyltransferase RlmJ [Frigidibacter sp. RF13]|uniref:23S rRNA (adenine(2030)-N(6))-methyltransferase RlmJ n=1 Tax=Frigidibacter sp. RF13 TaxID=2997340 RepID=UPI00226FCC04|nr:23S rRNA (adenine(2030)-N(6))-methyltransferase RlmJ [Frigidibacter sp. RF13]MCY1127366.1 23S rRNA (adenine(2030)-N(6))-methyltransferase RlmJ [Frigidibacter sp. RF13]